MNARRVERLQKEIQRELSRILLHELNDPRLGLITLTRVDLSPELDVAKIFCTVLGGEREWRKTAGALSHAHGYIQKSLGGRLSIRAIPEIRFVYDASVERMARMHQLLGDLEKERPRPAEGEAQPPQVD